MKTVTYNKLVRDSIPEYLKSIGVSSETKIIPADERLRLLLKKLAEEANEALESKPDKLIEELADVLEVVEATASLAGISSEQITSARNKKNDERGSFKNGVFLISTTEPDK